MSAAMDDLRAGEVLLGDGIGLIGENSADSFDGLEAAMGKTIFMMICQNSQWTDSKLFSVIWLHPSCST